MGLHTVAETARLIGVSQVSIYSYIKNGKLEAVIGGDKKKEGQRGTSYKISDEAIADFKTRYSIKGHSEEPTEFTDTGHVLQHILDFNHISIAGYAKLRKYGGYAYVSSILSGNMVVPKVFIEEFCKFFDASAKDLTDMIKLKKSCDIKLRPEYDSPDIHTIKSDNGCSIIRESDYVKAVVNQAFAKAHEAEENEEDTPVSFVYYISKSVRTTDNPEETTEVPLMPMAMYSSVEKAKKYLKSLAVRPDYIWINEDGTELIKTSVDKDTLKVTRTHLRIRKCEVS